MAKVYLSHNTNNRPVRREKVQEYINQLKTGRFVLDPYDCVGFNTDGVLVNGQHRLMAIAESGIGGWVVVVRNGNKDAFPIVDIGTKRSAGDAFDIAHITDSHNVAAIINKHQALRRNYLSSLGGAKEGVKSILSRFEILDFYYQHAAVINDITRFARDFSRLKAKLMRGSDIGALCLYLILDKRRDINTVKSFFTGLYRCGDELPTLLLLRRKLIDDRDAPRAAKMTSLMRRNLIATAWNAYIAGRNLKILTFKRDSLVEFK
ncbi:MAG: hypothetical protein LUD50_03235 [Clostridia bacterium]|nr:hypothetical protein [Clostridia bacterium]